MADAFRSYQVVRAIERITGANLRVGQLRIEYCQDVAGFWLEPHVDIPVKLITMLVNLTDAQGYTMPAPTSTTQAPSTSWSRALGTRATPD